jgi:predicted XRE-type DNA-binding protein
MEQQEFANVWDALSDSPDEADDMTKRSNLIIAIQRKVAGRKVTQAGAARRLRITQPRLNDLLRSEIDKFILDMLITLASHAGIAVRLENVA